MQLVPLSTDGRVTALGSAPLPAGRLRVVLEPDGAGVGLVALGPGTPRPVGRLGGHDVAAYRPVLLRLAARGQLGTCPAWAAAGGALVLGLGPAEDCVLANPAGDLVLLDAERTVTVTREEHHQDVLAGRSGRVAVALRPAAIAAGKYAGQRGLEVLLDGRRVGELTRLMAERYLPLVDEVAARGRRAGAEALLRPDHRGVQVEVRLPAVGTTARPAPEPVAAVPAPRRPSPVPPDGTMIAPPVVPSPAPRRSRRLLGATAAVVGVLVVASALGNAGTGTPTATTAADTTRSAAAPSTSTAPTSSASPTPTTRSEIDEDGAADVVVARPPRTTTRTVAPAPRSTSRTTTRTTTRRAPDPEPPARAAAADCHPSYSPCLPTGRDLDCPEIGRRVTVTGPDEYGLDRDGDGKGCDRG